MPKIYYTFGNGKNPGSHEKNNDAKPLRTSRLVKNDVNARFVRRRKSKETSREEEKCTVFSSTFNNDTVEKSALIEEYPKEIREVEVNSVIGQDECSFSNASRGSMPEFLDQSHHPSREVDGGRGEIESEISEGEDELDRKVHNKSVKWTEDNQKNLMDFGIYEIERNKRLESLIARRRARKLSSLQVRRTLMNVENSATFAQIKMLPGNNPPSEQLSPMPGSAPSVLCNTQH